MQKVQKELIKKYTYSEFKNFYLGYASSRFSQNYQEFIKIAFNQFAKVIDPDKNLSDITIIDIENFITLKRQKTREHIVNGYLRTLQGAFQRAIEFGMIEENLFRVVKKLKPPKDKPLFFSKEEFDLLIRNENEDRFKFLYKFGLLTGMRMGEIRFLKWNSIDFQKNLITINNHDKFTTKSKKSRDIPLHNSLMEELLKMKGQLDEYIFLNKGRQYTKDLLTSNFKAAVRRAKLNDKLHFHSLRHTFASWLVQAGVNIYEVSRLLGHSDIKTTQIYAHLRTDDLRQAVETLDFK
jgi:integrase